MATAWRLAKSLETLRNQVNAAYPTRSKASDGTIGDAAHASGASDHNPNANGVVAALDLTHDPARGFDAHALAEHLRKNRHPNLRYVISNARIAGAWTNWEWRPSSGHTQHVHISVGDLNVGDGQTTGRYDDTTAWNINYKGVKAMPTYQEVLNHFRTYIGSDPTEAQMNYYVARDWGVLNGDLLAWNHDRKKELQSGIASMNNLIIALNKQIQELKANDVDQATITDLQTRLQNATVQAEKMKQELDAKIEADVKADEIGQGFLRWLISKITGGK